MATVTFLFLSLFLSPLLIHSTLPLSSSPLYPHPHPPTLRWTYYPPNTTPKYGILMAGTRDLFHNHSSAYISICIAKLYAMQHQYAFSYHKNLGRVTTRRYGRCNSTHMSPWNKIPLLQRYLTAVEVLIWIDLDAVIQRMDVPLDQILPNSWKGSACNTYSDLRELGREIRINNSLNLPGSAQEPFLWITEDVSVRYPVNINTAVLALKRNDLAFHFLQDVWEAGQDPNLFKRYDPLWESKEPCVGYWGWPWEQGGIWSVLQASQVKGPPYLQGSCVLPHRGGQSLNSVTDQWQDGRAGSDRPFILHHSKVDLTYWLVYTMIKSMKPLALVRQVCHPSVGERYEEHIKRWNQLNFPKQK
jgi:hypothetical protein